MLKKKKKENVLLLNILWALEFEWLASLYSNPYIKIMHRMNIYIFLMFLTFIYFWDRERQSMNGGGSEREGDTESQTSSRLWAVSTEPDAGLELTDRKIVTWAEVGRLTDCATQASPFLDFQSMHNFEAMLPSNMTLVMFTVYTADLCSVPY